MGGPPLTTGAPHVEGEVEIFGQLITVSPTSIQLARFAAWHRAATVRVEWETANEVDLVGFHLYRGVDGPDGASVRLNEAPIPALSPGSPVGAAYEVVDYSAVSGVACRYWLDTVVVHGTATRYGPALAATEPAGSNRTYLPLVNR